MPPVAAPAAAPTAVAASQPGSHYRAKAGDREQPETSQQTCRTAKTGTDARAFAGTFGTIIDAIAITIDLFVGAVPAVRVVSDDADVRMRDAGSL